MNSHASLAEAIAEAAPGARVVKSFNTVSAQAIRVSRDHEFNMHNRATTFYCGDDDEAKSIASSLADEIGFEPVDAGKLHNARYLESLASLALLLAEEGKGFEIAVKHHGAW